MSLHSLIGSHIDGPPALDTAKVNASSPKPLRSHLRPAPAGELHDLVCVGFGPASLAIGIALHDSLESGKLPKSEAARPKVVFLEKQERFAWHAGMLLPGAKMQISFIKDLATLRSPRSHFTFLNFVHEKKRLIDFSNLGTFTPARAEFEEYLRWCAGHFGDVVQYGQEAVSVSPLPAAKAGEPVTQFVVSSRNVKTGQISMYRAKNVVLAIGGQPSIPKSLPANHPRILHSSQYAHLVPKILNQRDAPYRVAVIGAGQSAAEIFSNIQALYPNSRTYMVMRSEFLKPSDDSPFVNSIFNPEFIDRLYPKSAAYRKAFLADARPTNYAVVRLDLIEAIYERMYDQRRVLGSDEKKWPHRIMGGTEMVGLEAGDSKDSMKLRVRSLQEPLGGADGASTAGTEEVLDVDLIIAATGYQRKSHFKIIDGVADLLPDGPVAGAVTADELGVVKTKAEEKGVQVARNYSVQFAPGKVASGSGVWLQGCNEKTHGLSDTLLSVLATRSDEMVDSIFGGARIKQAKL
ncbi:L-lysine 6-monooxygenase (NADPH-requiring)-domain-containing protein [Xylariales sp. PMI_506]|nr:L-lysine 6-monooxygenase (NADPH-requiring)-domain-containing protein [Xylariales sp. PMI_506]